MTWQELLFCRLTGLFSGYISSATTKKSEGILGFERSVYYGIGRNSPKFGEFVAVFEPAWPQDEHEPGVAPFDTGGVAQGHIPLHPGSPTPEIVVRSSGIDLAVHQDELSAWAGSAYPPGDYRSAGEQSRPKSPAGSAIDLDGVSVSGETADERAWTWEGRILAIDYPQLPLTLRRLFITPERLQDYLDWLEAEQPLEAGLLSPHEDLVDAVSVTTDQPYESMMEHLRGESNG